MESLYNIAILGSLKFYWCCSSCHPIWLLDLRQDFAMLPPTSTLIILVFMTHNSRNKTQQPTYYSTGSQVSTVSRKKLSIPWGTSTLNEKGHRSKLSYIAYYVHLKSTLFMQDNFIIMSFCCVDEICSALYSKKWHFIGLQNIWFNHSLLQSNILNDHWTFLNTTNPGIQ